jgi:DNA invertase Pin-like site-specific DNA recombinase
MDDSTPEILDLRFAGKRRKRAEQERQAAAAELRQRVLDAHEAGVAVTRIAREASLSRQAVYEILGIRLASRHNARSLP